MSIVAYNQLIFSQSSACPRFCSLRWSTIGCFRAVSSRKLSFNNHRGLLSGPLSKTVTCAMKSYKLSDLSQKEVEDLKARPRINFSSIFSTVQPIVDDVRIRGDDAVKEYTSRFDKVELKNIIENVNELPDPELDEAVRESFDVAYSNIYAFHAAQKPVEKVVENMKGVRCKRVARSIGSVGLYVPGGTAVLPSTALMLAVPAQIAGCKTVVLATPPSSDGSICKEVLYCAKKAGVTHILKAGGAQAIAAMAWGTSSCPKVEKIYGPGNQYVTAAKMILQNSEAMVSIDMPAGPSEVLVIADKYASPVHIAADLLSQAEHGPDSQVVLVIVGEGVDIKAIDEEITKQCNNLPRGEFASKALSHSFTVFARDMIEAVTFSNLYAPEHLIINVEDAEKWESFIENAGSVFVGPWTPESVGDYASGTNHVLPTYGYARMYSGVSLDSFLKYITIQSLTEEGLAKLGPHVATMAEVEGLDAHKRAVTLRLQDIKARQAV
ncbi:histidinol dehydrogenase, chloroplastic-like [Bidens hawaiensis]|uniref:histidinol dehydrogenase, chloroplastic-like n=1 Tax=Bidens hawaiensis TaxID=980011 RepID=UPI00404B56B0